MRLPICLRHADNSSTICILIEKLIGRFGFWCAGLMARPAKKFTSVACSNKIWAICEAPSFWVAQAAASSRRDRKLAPELAIRALLDADLARARSNEAVARARWQQRRAEIDELQRNLGMEESR